MARKEFEMSFQLNAQLNSSFSGTFGKAQQQLINMQKDIQALNKLQENVASYQKQQQAVEGTQKKLEMLQQQYDNIQREIQETGTFSADLENKLLSKQQQIDKTSASLQRQTQKLGELSAELQTAGVDTKDLTKEADRLGAEMADKKKEFEEAAEGARGFGSASVSAFETAANALVAAGLVTGLKKVYEAYVGCINIAGNFEESMSTVAALSGASAEDLQLLSDLAKELGATTKFTAKESADAMGYMAMAGWDAQQMLAGMPGVLQLAAASGEDLALVSDIVTDSMTAFGLTAADTSRYADVLAATAANANTSVGVMGETFKYAAPVAGALGYSIEDVSTAIGLMANAGIKGSNAGTALRNVFNGLLGGVTLTSDAFGEIQVSAVQADGTMADFGTTINELREYFSQMSDAERVNNAMVIAGQRGYAGLLNILNATEADYEKLTEAINNSTGAAQRMADVRMDNMTGQLTLLNSAWEAVRTTIGEQFTPILEELYGAGADVLGEINAYLQEHPQLIKAATVLAGGLGAVATAIVGISAAAKVLKALNIGSLLVGAAGLTPLGWVAIAATGVTALTAAVVAFSDAQNDAEREINSLTATSREQYYQLQDLKAEYDAVCEVQGEYSADAQILKRKLDEETAAFENSKISAEDYAAAQKELIDAHNDLMSAYAVQTQDIDRNAESNANLMNKLLELVDAEEQTAAQKQQILTLVDMLNESLPELGLAYDANANALNMTADAIQAVIRAEVERDKKSADREHLKELIAEEADLEQAKADAIAEATARENEYNEALERQRAAVAAFQAEHGTAGGDSYWRLYASQLTSYTTAVENARNAWNDAQAIADVATSAFAENQAAIQITSEGLATFVEVQEEASRGTVEIAEAIASTTEKVRLLTEEYNAAYEAAYSSITGQYDLWDRANDVVATSVGNINAALESQIAHWNEYNEDLALLRERAADIEGLSDVIASFADGSNESVNAVAGMASATDEDLAAMVQNWRDLQQAQSETSDVIADFKTDFTNQMDELTQQLQDDIEALDMSADAAESGRATIQAFIDSAAAMESSVQAAYARLGRAAASALSSASGTSVTVNTHGYAIGTNYAEAGLALVGENGPELMMMQGGEKILTAAETRALQEEYVEAMMFLPELYSQLRGYAIGTGYASAGPARVGEQGPEAIIGAQFTIPHIDAEEALSVFHGNGDIQITMPAISITVGDNTSAETVEELKQTLTEFRDDLAERVMEIVEEAKEDELRRAYK